MTTRDWLRIRPIPMALADLVPTHELRHPLSGPDTSHCGDAFPHVVYWHGRYRISDGHHRIARAQALGRLTMLVRVAIPTVHFNRSYAA